MRTRSDCFSMSHPGGEDEEEEKGESTPLSLTRKPSMAVSGVRSHPPVDPGSAPLRLLPYPLSRGEPARTRCFPSHVMHLPLYNRGNAPSLLLPVPEPNNMFLTQLSETKPACQRSHMFHCIRASWSQPCNIGRLDHRKSQVSMSTQLLFSGAIRSFIFVQEGATHTQRERAVYGACVLVASHAGRHAFCE